MKRHLLLLCLVLVSAVHAQQMPSATKAPTPGERWLRPAQRLSAAIDSDLWRLMPHQQAVARAQLASIWWKQDPTGARAWAVAAVDWVTHVPENELDSDRAQRIRAARLALSQITPLDPALSQRISDMLLAKVQPAGQQGTAATKGSYTTILNAAMRDTAHPEQLAQTISESMPSGITSVTIQAIITLRDAKPDEADILFRRVLSSAEGSDTDSISALASAISPPPGSRQLPAVWREPIFASLAHALSESSDSAAQRTKLCQISSHLYGQTDFPPDLVSAVAHARSYCAPPQPSPDQVFDSNLLRQSAPKTADDFLELIPQLKTAPDRAQIRINAAARAEMDNKDPERALKIMDDATPDEIVAQPGLYRLRMELAIRAALHAIDDGRSEDAYRIMDKSPSISAFYISVSVLQKSRKPLPSKFFDLALREMDAEQTDNPMDYVNLMNLYFKKGDLSPVDAIVAEMDRWKRKDPKALKPGEVFYTAPWDWLTPLPLGRDVADCDADAIAAHFANAQTIPLRVELQIALTRAWIGRYESAVPGAEAGATGVQ